VTQSRVKVTQNCAKAMQNRAKVTQNCAKAKQKNRNAELEN
jgi:hypothetical protein